MALTTRLTLNLEAVLASVVGVNIGVSAKVSQAFSSTFESGTGADQADKMYSAERTLAASATEDLDLAGVLTDVFGATITFADVAALIIQNTTAAGGNNVVIGAAGSNPWVGLLNAAGTVTLRPGQIVAAFQNYTTDAVGFPVVAATGDLLKVANAAGGSSVTYKVTIIGRSA
jgi:hypothetical protein